MYLRTCPTGEDADQRVRPTGEDADQRVRPTGEDADQRARRVVWDFAGRTRQKVYFNKFWPVLRYNQKIWNTMSAVKMTVKEELLKVFTMQ